MSWEAATLVILAAGGLVTLLLAQLREILVKTAEVLDAWKRVRRALEKLNGGGRKNGADVGGDDGEVSGSGSDAGGHL